MGKNKTAIITILGIVDHLIKKDKQSNENREKTENEKASYKVHSSLTDIINPKKEKFTNIFPLLVSVFSENDKYIIIPIGTEKALETQKKVIEFERLKDDVFKNERYIKPEYENVDIFQLFNDTMEQYDEVIIDVTHGYRHLPILMILTSFMQNIKYPDKIKHIIFGKEVKQNAEYEIIDLIEYLDIANTTYLLSNFKQNFTLTNSFKFKDSGLGELQEKLQKFSRNILANSINILYGGKEPLLNSIIESLNKIKGNPIYTSIQKSIDDTLKYFEKLKKLENEEKEYKKLYSISEDLFEKGYLLNSLTILNEAVAYYILYKFEMNGSEELKDAIKQQEKESKKNEKNGYYKLLNGVSSIFKENVFENNYKGFLKGKPSALKNAFTLQKEYGKQLINLVTQLDQLRNNFAHADSAGYVKYEDVEKEINKLLEDFKKICI